MTATLTKPAASPVAPSAATLPAELPRVVASGVAWEQFLMMDDDRHLEWVDGEVIEQPMPSSEHQRLFGFLFRLFADWSETFDLGEVFSDPFLMYVLPGSRGRAPDIAFVAKANLSRVQHNSIHGPADLVVEITSSSTGHVDRGGKFQEYQRGGVREYWLLDPDAQSANFYRLANSVFEEVEPHDGIYNSEVLSRLWLRTEWLWQRPLLAAVRRELGLL